jgi:hypothetical protein
MTERKIAKNFGDLMINAVISRVDSETLGKMVDAAGDGLDWEAPEGPARMNGAIFINAAETCKRNEWRMRELAESYNQMFGIPTEEAVRRIKLAERFA